MTLRPALILCCAALGLAACAPAPESAPKSAVPAAKPVAVAPIAAPAGRYTVDHNHADLRFAVRHLGLADYVARFEGYSAEIQFDPDNLADSALNVEIDPNKVVTGYAGDYKATHPKSSFSSWEEDLARSPRFFDADNHPQIRYRSTKVTPQADGSLHIDGELTLRGQTHPVSLHAHITGSLAEHPFTKKGALGFSAEGRFLREKFGMDFLLDPPLLGNEVQVNFDGEFHQAASAP